MRPRLLEILAVGSSLGYTILISYGIIWCWLFAALSAGFFLALCWQRKIYAEFVLQLFYLYMAYYGWQNWGNGLAESPEMRPLNFHLLALLIGALITAAWSLVLRKFTDSKLPEIDAFTTVFSIWATLLMVQLYPENWLYWIVIDAVSIYLYYRRDLKLSAVLFLLYTLLSINGFWQWTH